MTFSDLPTVNACLNAIAALLLLAGRWFIKRGDRKNHRKCMLAAVGVSSLFLVFYVLYHAQHGSTPFQGGGWTRLVYFTILVTHTVLAAAVVPLVLFTLRRALKERFVQHRALARWTFPIWLYVSVTGVIIYLMLYHWFPPGVPQSAATLPSSML